jgi:hypothetical protein
LGCVLPSSRLQQVKIVSSPPLALHSPRSAMPQVNQLSCISAKAMFASVYLWQSDYLDCGILYRWELH